ncbi:hypothetical protein ACGJA2_004215 [Pseudomonas aeruginosa]
MPVFEVVSGGDRRSLMKRFERKSKQQAISELVDFHLLNCDRIEKLEAERDAALARVAELTATRNRYGVDAHYFNKNLQRILRNFESFTPDELARSLIILAKVADEKVVAQAQHSVPEASEQEKEQGWTLDYRFVERVTDLAASRTEYTTSMEATEQVLLAARELLAAAPAQAQHSVPEGWKPVPIEPTPEMLDARRDCEDGMDGYLVEDTEYYFPGRDAVRAFLARVYRGLIAAAPAPGGER